MGGTGVIDRFLEVFTTYIDSGFGLLGSEVGFLATTLAAIDLTLAGLFWYWGTDEDVAARLVKKTLFLGVFAYLIGNWNNLARIVFESFAGLGLKASGTGLSAADFLRPGRVAQVGLDAGRPILDSISGLMGFVSFFEKIEAEERHHPGSIPKVFSTHPPTPERVQKAQNEIATILPARDEYIVTTSEFDLIKSRLRRIENKNKLQESKSGGDKPTLRTRTEQPAPDKTAPQQTTDDSDPDRPVLKKRTDDGQ